MAFTQNIGYMLQHLSSVLARQSDQVLQEQLGIGFSQFKILMALQNGPSILQKKIAASLGQTEASISRQIKKMHHDGLLISAKNPQNKREHFTRVTPKGLRITDRATEILNNYHSPMFQRLSAKQHQQLLETLDIMAEHACVSGEYVQSNI